MIPILNAPEEKQIMNKYYPDYIYKSIEKNVNYNWKSVYYVVVAEGEIKMSSSTISSAVKIRKKLKKRGEQHCIDHCVRGSSRLSHHVCTTTKKMKTKQKWNEM